MRSWRCVWAYLATLVALGLAMLLGGGQAGAAPAAEGYRLGSASAPVEIREYADLQCPVCRAAHRRTLPTVIRRLVDTGRAALVFRPLAFIGPDSLRGAQAAAAAARQNRVWPLAQALYAEQGPENSGWLTEARLRRVAARVPGLDTARFDRDRAARARLLELQQIQDEAVKARVRGTPTFVIRGLRGTRVLTGVVPPEQVVAAVQAVR